MTDNFERTPGGAVLMDGIRLRGEIIASLRTTIETAKRPTVEVMRGHSRSAPL